MCRIALALTGLMLSGCVIVNPGEVNWSASPKPFSVSSKQDRSPSTAYGPKLERVLKKQEQVVKKLQKRDWKDVVEETAEWTEDVRILSGYADTTHDPVKFRAYCDQLLAQTENVRLTALRQDAPACNAAIHGCDPILDHLSRDFPTRVAVASPPPQTVATPYPSQPRTSVNVQVP